MRKILLALSLLVGFASQALAADNYAATAGSGLTFGAKDAAGILYSRFIGCDNTTVSQCWSIDSSGRQLVTITSGSVASGAFASGSIASGAMAAGSHAAGSGVDGWDLTQGAIADAAVTAGATGSVSAKLRSISRDVMTVNTWAGGTLGAMATYGTSPGAVNVPGVNAYVTNTLAPGQAAAASSSPVVVAKNSGTGSTVAGAAVGTAGTASAEVVTVQGVASMTPLLTTATPSAGTSGGATPAAIIAANSNNSTSLKGSAGMVYGVQTSNIDTAAAWLKLYDKATAPTCGTDTPVGIYLIPPSNSGNNVVTVVGKVFTLGIGYCIVTGIATNDNTAVPAAKIAVNFDYK